MAKTTDSLNRRTLSPAVGSAVIGLALGVVAVIGVSQFSANNSIPESNAIPADSAVLGGPEYGTRN